MVSCQGCGEETSERLCCPQCEQVGRVSFFCSQKCFGANWAAHNELHSIIRKARALEKAVPSSSHSATALSAEGEFPSDSREEAASQRRLSAAGVSPGGAPSSPREKSGESEEFRGQNSQQAVSARRAGPSLPVVEKSGQAQKASPREAPFPRGQRSALSRLWHAAWSSKREAQQELPLHALGRDGAASSGSGGSFAREKGKAKKASLPTAAGTGAAAGARPLLERRLAGSRRGFWWWGLLSLAGLSFYLWLGKRAVHLGGEDAGLEGEEGSSVSVQGPLASASDWPLRSAEKTEALSQAALREQLFELRQEVAALSSVVQTHSFLWSFLASPAQNAPTAKGGGKGAFGEAVASRLNSEAGASALAPDAPLHKLLALLPPEGEGREAASSHSSGSFVPVHKAFDAGVEAEALASAKRSEPDGEGVSLEADRSDSERERAQVQEEPLQGSEAREEVPSALSAEKNGSLGETAGAADKEEALHAQDDALQEEGASAAGASLFSHSLYSGEGGKAKRARRSATASPPKTP